MRPKPVPRGSVGAPIGSNPGNKAILQRNQGPMAPATRVDEGNIIIPDSPTGEQRDEPAKEQASRPSSLHANGESGEVDLEQSPETERLLLHHEPDTRGVYRRRRRTARRSRSR
eukprot:9448690-Heterocapsa_arctica.AAC.1